MKNILIMMLSITSVFSITVDEATGWEFDQSTLQAFYMLEVLTVDGEIAESEDVVGAFFEGVCVGFVNADPNGYTTVPLMGNDGGDYDYLSVGEVPNLILYDASSGSLSYLPVDVSGTTAPYDVNDDGTIDLEGLDDIHSQMEDALEECGVEPFYPVIGLNFKTQDNIADNPKRIPTNDKNQHETVAEVSQIGYLRRREDTSVEIISKAKVVIYDYAEPENNYEST